MKRVIILVLVFCFYHLSLNGQESILLNGGITRSNFNFSQSDGFSNVEMNPRYNQSFSLQYKQNISDYLFLRPSVDYIVLGSKSILYNVPIEWTLNYIGLNIGTGFKFETESFSIYSGGSGYFSIMESGEQFIGGDRYNLREEESMKLYDFGLNGFIGTGLPIADNMKILLELIYRHGLNDIEKDASQLYNNAFSLRTGIEIIIR